MITLGLNAAFHDSAAALVIDGVPVAAAEEERFTRIKHAKRPLPFTAWELPFHAIVYCLEQAGLSLRDVDHVAYSFDPALFVADRSDLSLQAGTITLPMQPSAQRDPRLAPWDSPWDPLFLSYMVNAPRQLMDGAPHHLARRLHGGERPAEPRWQWHPVGHHLCHQASAFLAAPFEHCAVMTLDGRGERATTTYGAWRDGRYRTLGEVHVPQSLGLLYERVTEHLGFLSSSDEYKVMALAAMGQPLWGEIWSRRLRLHGRGRFEIDPIDLTAVAGPARVPGAPLEQRHFDLAASLQHLLEHTALALAGWLREASGEAQLALAGGVALNCLMNSRLRDDGPFDAVWVQPAAGDAGTALGAALWTDARQRPGAEDGRLAPRRWQMDHVYLGPAWSDAEIAAVLQWAGLAHEVLADDAAVAERGAELLAEGNILGWFQGRMEWGPRALGGRSILASPIDPDMQRRLNDLKDREDFRPVAPAVPAEAFGDWFTPTDADGAGSPYMLFTYQARPEQASRIPSACHSDGSARVQAVHAGTNPRFHALLQAFGRRTGVPVLVNTSFNVRGEPIVCTPRDALDAYFTTPLDALLIGRFLLVKPRVVPA